MFRSRHVCLLVSTALLMSVGLAQVDKEYSETVPFEPGSSLRIENYKGSIHVSSWDRPEVEIQARISPPEGEEPGYAASVVEATEIEVKQRRSRLVIRSNSERVPSKGGWLSKSKNLAYVHFEIRAPREVDLTIDDYKSAIELYGLSGSIQLETYKGSINGTDLTGQLDLNTYKGEVDLEAFRGSLSLETYKGSVAVQALEVDGSSKIETYRGDIELTVSGSQGLTLQADPGRRGTIAGSLVGAEKEPGREGARFVRQINDGGPTLKASTYRGTILLNRIE